MDYRVDLTSASIEDLKDIAGRIAQGDKQTARRYGDKLIDKALFLGKFPEIGRVVPEYGRSQFREIIHGPYRIVYRLFKDKREIHILRFWHASRGMPEISI